MYSGGSVRVVGKASTIGIEISPTPLLIFTEGSKSAKFGVAHVARYPNSKTNFLCSYDPSMSSRSLVKLSLRIPENRSISVLPLKLHGENVLNCQ